MQESTKVLYQEILERYVKVIWTHKIHLCQVELLLKKNTCRNNILAILSCLVSLSAIANVLKWLPESLIVPVLAILSLVLAFFTLKYKSDNLTKQASENEHFAARMHDLRNRYSGLLADIKSGLLENEAVIEQRKFLEHEEDLIYSGIVPITVKEAVMMAEKALKTNQDSTTTEEEIRLLVSRILQVDDSTSE